MTDYISMLSEPQKELVRQWLGSRRPDFERLSASDAAQNAHVIGEIFLNHPDWALDPARPRHAIGCLDGALALALESGQLHEPPPPSTGAMPTLNPVPTMQADGTLVHTPASEDDFISHGNLADVRAYLEKTYGKKQPAPNILPVAATSEVL